MMELGIHAPGNARIPAAVYPPPTIRYTHDALQLIGSICSQTPLPAQTIDAIIRYELRCEPELCSLFKGSEFHNWQGAPQKQGDTHGLTNRGQKVDTHAVQVELRIAQLESRLQELDHQHQCSSLAVGQRLAELENSCSHRDSDPRTAAFEAGVDAKHRKTPGIGRHEAEIKIVQDRLEKVKAASLSFATLLAQLDWHEEGYNGVLKDDISGFDSVSALARNVLPHVQQLEYGLKELAFGKGAVGKEKDAASTKENSTASPTKNGDDMDLSSSQSTAWVNLAEE